MLRQRVVEYATLKAQTLGDLDKMVNEYLKKEWVLCGIQYQTIEPRQFVQPMVRVEEFDSPSGLPGDIVWKQKKSV